MSACAGHKTHNHTGHPQRPARRFGLRTRVALIAAATFSIVLGGGVPLAASAVAPTAPQTGLVIPLTESTADAQTEAVSVLNAAHRALNAAQTSAPVAEPLGQSFGELAQELLAEFNQAHPERLPFTAGEQAAAAWLAGQLVAAGFDSELVTVQEFNHSELDAPQAFTLNSLGWDRADDAIATSQNVFVRIPGTDADAGIIVVGANYDTFSLPGFRQDPASGTNVAVLLEAARSLAAQPLPETTYLAFFGADVIGRAGAHYFFSALPVAEQADIRLLVDVDLIGAADNLFVTADVCDGGERCVEQSAAFSARIAEIIEEIGSEIVLFKEENFDLAELPTCACCVFGTPEAVVNVPVVSFFAFDFAGNGLPDAATSTAQNNRALAAYQQLLQAILRADRAF